VLEAALRRYLDRQPLAVALWRGAELVVWRQLAPAGEILDLGCGDGLFGSSLFAGLAVVGIDADAHAVAAAVRTGAYRQVVQGDIHALPFAPASFDTVFANCVIEHVAEPERVLGEAHRVLRGSGRLLFSVPTPDFGSLLGGAKILRRLGLDAWAGAYAGRVNAFLGHHHLLSPAEWRRALERAGFESIAFHPYASASLVAAFDLLGLFGVPALVAQRALHRSWVLPKAAVLAPLLRRAVSREARLPAGGVVVEAFKRAGAS
jgi:SAM-dependent methyltransferase